MAVAVAGAVVAVVGCSSRSTSKMSSSRIVLLSSTRKSHGWCCRMSVEDLDRASTPLPDSSKHRKPLNLNRGL